jgi:paraquat-inducible protein A
VNTVVACETCGLVQRLEEPGPGLLAECARCGARLADHRPNSLARTAAFSLAALCFYVPANVFPILQMDLYGVHSENTVWEGARPSFSTGRSWSRWSSSWPAWSSRSSNYSVFFSWS